MNMIVVVAIIVIFVGLIASLKFRAATKDSSLAFQSREPFLSPAERSFLGVLDQALDDRYRIFVKVRLGDLVKPAKGLSNSKRVTVRNKVNQKHVDFVVCTATDLAVVGAIELDDQSHGREDRMERDVLVDHALSCAGIPIARFSAKKGYQIQELRSKLAEVFKFTMHVPTPTLPTSQEPTPPKPMSTNEQVPTPIAAQPKAETSPKCGRCGATMVRRQAKNGPHAGKFFWACSTFPKCRQVIEMGSPTGTP